MIAVLLAVNLGWTMDVPPNTVPQPAYECLQKEHPTMRDVPIDDIERCIATMFAPESKPAGF